ncbi:putative F-box domain-containing protein [Tanacetum coccineum]
MSYNIPFDIQAEIIKSLPVKLIIRFRLVSKQWKSLIDSSKFIAEYQKHKRHRHLLVKFEPFFNSDDQFVSIVDDDTFPQHKVSLTVPMSVKLLPQPNTLISSQGLVFLHRYDRYYGTTKALIWNPTIRKSVEIDVCCALKPNYLTFGFGVCPDTCDPKIVKFTVNQYLNKRDPIFEVFTLSTNAWRRLSKNLPRERIYFTGNHFTGNQVAIDRFMYWIAYEKIYMDVGNRSWYKRNLIVSFDMTSEEFTEVNLPGSLDVDPASNFNLYNIGESLVVVHFKKEAGKRVHSVWKMMEHGASKSLTKLYTINTTDGINHVHGFRKSGEPIAETKNNHQKDLFAYELDSKHLNYIGIFGNQYLFRVSSYFETLLLLDQ